MPCSQTRAEVLRCASSRYLVNDTIIIRYCIELVVSTGGALSRNGQVVAPKQAVISVPPSNMGRVRPCSAGFCCHRLVQCRLCLHVR